MMTTNRQQLSALVETAFLLNADSKFNDFRRQLSEFSTALTAGEDELKVMVALRRAILQADLSLKLPQRITGLPSEYQALYNFIDPQLQRADSKLIDQYTHFGFVPLKYGSTVKYP